MPLIPGFFAVWWGIPQDRRRPADLPLGIGILTILFAGAVWIRPSGDILFDGLFYLFAGLAVLSAGCMIGQSNPVYAALWFAVVILNTCGLFLLQSAPFLAAATIIVYAGAIIVTFMFVIMLAQQTGKAEYDQHSTAPGSASFAAIVLLGALLYTFNDRFVETNPEKPAAAHATTPATESPVALIAAHEPPAAKPTDAHAPKESAIIAGPPPSEVAIPPVRSLGLSLFGEYLWGVEIAGTLLTIAVVGAIAIAPQRMKVVG